MQTPNWWLRFGLAFTLMAFLFTAPLAKAQGQPTLRVNPAALTAQVNETLTLAIWAENVSNLTAFELHLTFNPAALEVQQVSSGGFVAEDFSVQNVYDNTVGTIDYAAAQMNRPPAQGSGVLLSLTLRAKANGVSPLTLRPTQASPNGFLLSDQNGAAISVVWNGATLTVGAPVTPIPTTITPIPTAITPVTPVAATVTPTPLPAINGLPGSHTVRLGEWLYCIGRAYHVSPDAIAQANGLWWPYFVFPNQVLRIPNVPWVNMPAGPACQAQFSTLTVTASPAPTTPAPVTLTPAPPTPGVSCRATYLVQPGDTLYSIAGRYGTTYTEVARVNQISNPWLIYPGQQLCLP